MFQLAISGMMNPAITIYGVWSARNFPENSVNVSIQLFIYLPIYPSIQLSSYLAIQLTTVVSRYLDIQLSGCLAVWLSFDLSIYRSISSHLISNIFFVYLQSIYISVYLMSFLHMEKKTHPQLPRKSLNQHYFNQLTLTGTAVEVLGFLQHAHGFVVPGESTGTHLMIRLGPEVATRSSL